MAHFVTDTRRSERGISFVPPRDPRRPTGLTPSAIRARARFDEGRGPSRSSRLASAYQKAYDEATAANEKRYQEILTGFRQRRTRALSFLEGAGKQESADITQQFTNLQASGQQDLVSRGLTGTGVLSSQRRGIASSRVAAQGRLNERLQQQRLDVDTRLSGDTLGFMERREDPFPDFQQLQQLAFMQGQGQGGRAGRFQQGGGGFSGLNTGFFAGVGGRFRKSAQPVRGVRTRQQRFQQTGAGSGGIGGALGGASGGLTIRSPFAA